MTAAFVPFLGDVVLFITAKPPTTTERIVNSFPRRVPRSQILIRKRRVTSRRANRDNASTAHHDSRRYITNLSAKSIEFLGRYCII